MPEMKCIHSPAILVTLCCVSGSIIWCFWVVAKEIVGRPNAFFGKRRMQATTYTFGAS